MIKEQLQDMYEVKKQYGMLEKSLVVKMKASQREIILSP